MEKENRKWKLTPILLLLVIVLQVVLLFKGDKAQYRKLPIQQMEYKLPPVNDSSIVTVKLKHVIWEAILADVERSNMSEQTKKGIKFTLMNKITDTSDNKFSY